MVLGRVERMELSSTTSLFEPVNRINAWSKGRTRTVGVDVGEVCGCGWFTVKRRDEFVVGMERVRAGQSEYGLKNEEDATLRERNETRRRARRWEIEGSSI